MKMKSFLSVMSLFVVMFFSVGAFAQQDDTSDQDKNIYNKVDSSAYFEQGKEVLSNLIIQATKYPQSAIGSGLEGVVMTRFVVERDGYISNLEIQTGLNPALNAEALRVISSIKGLWVPAKKNGHTVRSIQYVPVGFVAPK